MNAPAQVSTISNGGYDCLTILRTSEQVLLDGTLASVSLNGLPALKSILDTVVKMTRDFDDVIPSTNIARHRFWGGLKPSDFKLLPPYPPHVIVRVGSADEATVATDYLNRLFSSNRGFFPAKKGWKAVRALAGDDFSLNSPFFRYKEMGKLDSKCARFVVVKDRAVEGMNNKFLMIEAVATADHMSLNRNIQSRGRNLRSPGFVDQKGIVHVPPEEFDRFYVVTHESYNGGAVAQRIVESLDFISNMTTAIGTAQFLDDYISEFDERMDVEAVDYTPKLFFEDMLGIAQEVGKYLNGGQRIQRSYLVNKYAEPKVELHKAYVRAVVDSASSGARMPYTIKKDGNLEVRHVSLRETIERRLRVRLPAPIDIVVSETLESTQMDADTCRDWMRKRGDVFAAMLKSFELNHGEDVMVRWVNEMERTMDAAHRKETIVIPTSARRQVALIEAEIYERLGQPKSLRDRVSELLENCVMSFLSRTAITSMADLDEDGPLNVAAVTHSLREHLAITGRTSFKRESLEYIVKALLDAGELTNLQMVLALRGQTA